MEEEDIGAFGRFAIFLTFFFLGAEGAALSTLSFLGDEGPSVSSFLDSDFFPILVGLSAASKALYISGVSWRGPEGVNLL